jgi:hypothetical protein
MISFPYATVPGLARELGVSFSKVDYLLRSRGIKTTKIGQTRLVGPEGIQKVKEALQARKSPEPARPINPFLPVELAV